MEGKCTYYVRVFDGTVIDAVRDSGYDSWEMVGQEQCGFVIGNGAEDIQETQDI